MKILNQSKTTFTSKIQLFIDVTIHNLYSYQTVYSLCLYHMGESKNETL